MKLIRKNFFIMAGNLTIIVETFTCYMRKIMTGCGEDNNYYEHIHQLQFGR